MRAAGAGEPRRCKRGLRGAGGSCMTPGTETLSEAAKKIDASRKPIELSEERDPFWDPFCPSNETLERPGAAVPVLERAHGTWVPDLPSIRTTPAALPYVMCTGLPIRIQNSRSSHFAYGRQMFPTRPIGLC